MIKETEMKKIICYIAVLTLFFAAAVYPEEAGKDVKPANNAAAKGIIILGLSPGYYMPLGDMGSILESGFSIKLCAQYNKIGGSPLGIAFESGYTGLKDKDNRGGITFIPVIGYATLTVPYWNFFDIHFRAGAGLTGMIAEVDNGVSIEDQSSADFTLSAGGGIMKTIMEHYVVGVETTYYLFFEKESSHGIGINGFLGYRF